MSTTAYDDQFASDPNPMPVFHHAVIPDSLLEISRQLHRQDNRGTSHPIFQVRKLQQTKDVHREVLVNEGSGFFTHQAAEDWIKIHQKRHDESLYVFVESGWRNPEWQQVRNFLLSLTNPTTPE